MSDSTITRIQLVLKDSVRDVAGERVEREARRYLGLDTGRVRSSKVYSILTPLTPEQVEIFARRGLRDEVLHEVFVNEPWIDPSFASFISVGKLPGVTDDEGASAEKTLRDILGLREHSPSVVDAVDRVDPVDTVDSGPVGRSFPSTPSTPSTSSTSSTAAVPHSQGVQQIFAHDVYLIERALSRAALRRIAEELLGNVLVHDFEVGGLSEISGAVPDVRLEGEPRTGTIDIFVPDDELTRLSRDRVLSLSLEEMRAIQAHYRDPRTVEARRARGMSPLPTDCEIEALAQTWSEHCKHKELNAIVRYRDLDTGEERTIDSLFRTYIKAATDTVRARLEQGGGSWLVKVFSDNAGVVRIDDNRLFVLKVETHNTPSALDPYGGALTGILGNNRDPLGTGRGGGRLLFNTNVLCFGPPGYSRPLLTGQLHPKRVFSGVREGIEHGGNKSGVPTVNGAIVFDDRYAGKPLVYCGTGSVMPAFYRGEPAWEKEIRAGDLVFMAGGRVGKDGIHGATFSSAGIDKHSPRSAVQIGSPITQKLLTDFLEEATERGLVRCTTDNGAGGLSSSIGELAPLSGGAVVRLDRVPLKYHGLAPWEILVSESQERMTLAVDPASADSLRALAARHEVEVTEVGEFTASGVLDVRYGRETVALLDLEFLHHGVPRKTLDAEWRRPALSEPTLPVDLDPGDLLLRLLGSLDICSREPVIRQYDHEVKGKTVVKPLMGPRGIAPQDAAVMRIDHEEFTGVAVSCGIAPRYGDLDAYEMSAGAFDEAVRQIVAAGGRIPDPDAPLGGGFWSACDNFCVPDSAHDPVTNPDGKTKLAQLVRMCEALRDMSAATLVPMTSGKDSMKNDLRADGVTISVPPTILYTMVAKMDDVRRAVTTELKAPGDLVYLLGRTYDELGGSELYKLFNEIGANVPRVRRDDALRLYREVAAANDERLIESCHDLSDGGLAVALAECCFGGDLGARLDVTQDDLSLLATLFSETHSRFVASVRPEHRVRFEAVMGRDARLLGEVTLERRMRLRWQGRTVVDLAVDRLVEAWSGGLGLVDHVDGVDRVDRAPAGQLWPSRSSTVSTSSTSSTTGAAKSHTTVKALVLTGFGINCEEETAAAFRLAGAEARTVHLNAVLDGACSIHEFDVLALPGGFSFGDDLGAGKVLANKLRTRRLPSRRLLVDEIRAFLRDGKLVLGICNGFQALVKMGLLPDVRGEGVQEVSLTTNDSGRFEDRWCRLVVHHPVRTPFLEGIEMLELPVRHGEGKLVIRGAEVREHILARSLCCLSYCDRDGRPTARYPDNPNGSDLCCAALTDETGQVLGMMPHPEAYLSLYNHPDWPARVRRGATSTEGDGLKVFRNIVRHMEAGK